jgi:hypothetical protein
MGSALADKIAGKRSELVDLERQLAELERRIEVLRAEIAAYEDAMSMIEAVDPMRRTGRVQRARVAGPKRERRVSTAWLSILRDIGNEGDNPIDLAEIAKIAGKHGKADITAANIRSQMALFAKRDVVERVHRGRYKLTEAGRRWVETQLKQADDAELAAILR